MFVYYGICICVHLCCSHVCRINVWFSNEQRDSVDLWNLSYQLIQWRGCVYAWQKRWAVGDFEVGYRLPSVQCNAIIFCLLFFTFAELFLFFLYFLLHEQDTCLGGLRPRLLTAISGPGLQWAPWWGQDMNINIKPWGGFPCVCK